MASRTYLKKKIFVPDQGEAKHQPAGILVYFEELMRVFNADMVRKDFFETGSNQCSPNCTEADEARGINLV